MASGHFMEGGEFEETADLVISTRLVPPRTGPLVQRIRLFALLDEGVRRRLTVIVGPPGTGKSALLASWVQSSDRLPGPLAWLALDEEDNDPARLFTHLVAALWQAGTSVLDYWGADDPAMVFARERTIPALVNAISASLSTPIVLVLDDFHELRPGPSRVAVLQLIRHAPDGLRVILASRREPDLPLHKLRAAGELAEVRGSDLAFTHEEVDELFARAGARLRHDQSAKLLRTSSGWALALKLAAVTRTQDGGYQTCLEGWSKVIRLCSDFLLRELVEPMPLEDQELLLRTSVVPRLHSSLVKAITGRADASRVLRSLSAEHDLLIRQDEWTYRHHPLVRQVLFRELTERHGAAEVAAVQRTAWEWYSTHGMTDLADRLAAAAGLPYVDGRTARTVDVPPSQPVVEALRPPSLPVLRPGGAPRDIGGTAAEDGMPETGTLEIGTRAGGTPEIGTPEIGTRAGGNREYGIRENATRADRAGEARTGEGRTDEGGAGESATGEGGAGDGAPCSDAPRSIAPVTPDTGRRAALQIAAVTPEYGQRLTASESEVLRLLPSRLTLDEIAAQRRVSPNTVKTQVKGIYRKLRVCRRRDAVEIARRMGLL
ncbi:AAA family ATPase [Streptomyces sp. NPDC051776]|uniref:helix-turn-helix transcriptional regulator n=1 Tax=Streptomyces sp. NPDC051776 TaxID=3155414 RepID=UPI00342D4AE1